MEQKYMQCLQEIAEKNHYTLDEVKHFKDIRIGFERGWNAALKSQWRAASEELPEPFERVVVFANGEFITAEYNEEQSCWFEAMSDETYSFIDQVTHWMPIPDLP